MKKSTFLKACILLLIFLIAVPMMTGCGLSVGYDGHILVNGGAYNPEKPAGNFFNTYVYCNGIGGTPTIGNDAPDDGMVKRAFIVYGAGTNVELSNFENAPLKIPLEHMIAHLAVSVCGASATCGIYGTCFASGMTVSFDPFQMANTALGIGSSIASSVAGFSTGLAAGMMVAVWFGNMLTMVVQERFTIEALLKGCMQLIIGLFVVYNAKTFAQLFVGLLQGNTTMQGNNDFANAAGAALSSIKAYYVALGFNLPVLQCGVPLGYFFCDDIGTAATIAVGCVMVLGAQISCAIAAVSAMVPVGLEMTLRIQLAPLVLAMSSQTGWSPPVINYLKGCIAAGLTPTIIAMMVQQAPSIANNLGGGNLLTMAVMHTIVYKAMGGFMGQASTIAHQVLSH